MIEEVIVRKGEDEDVAFITNSWLSNFRDADMVRHVPNRFYYHYHHKLLEEIIPKSAVRVACNIERPSQILGWICAQAVDNALVVHFCYVKLPFRRFGVAKMLLKSMQDDYGLQTVFYTHKTHMCVPRSEEKQKELGPGFYDKIKAAGFIYNPYLLWMPVRYAWETSKPQD
jgi:hypothetical protein